MTSADLGAAESERLNEALERGLTAYTYLDDTPPVSYTHLDVYKRQVRMMST